MSDGAGDQKKVKPEAKGSQRTSKTSRGLIELGRGGNGIVYIDSKESKYVRKFFYDDDNDGGGVDEPGMISLACLHELAFSRLAGAELIGFEFWPGRADPDLLFARYTMSLLSFVRHHITEPKEHATTPEKWTPIGTNAQIRKFKTLFASLLVAVDRVHSSGLYHGDVAFANVMLNRVRRPAAPSTSTSTASASYSSTSSSSSSAVAAAAAAAAASTTEAKTDVTAVAAATATSVADDSAMHGDSKQVAGEHKNEERKPCAEAKAAAIPVAVTTVAASAVPVTGSVFDADWSLHFIDWGSASLREMPTEYACAPPYRGPEFWRVACNDDEIVGIPQNAKSTYTMSSEMWSLGMVMLQCLCWCAGKTAYDSVPDRTASEFLAMIADSDTSKRVVWHKILSDIDATYKPILKQCLTAEMYELHGEELWRILSACLAPDAEHRPSAATILCTMHWLHDDDDNDGASAAGATHAAVRPDGPKLFRPSAFWNRCRDSGGEESKSHIDTALGEWCLAMWMHCVETRTTVGVWVNAVRVFLAYLDATVGSCESSTSEKTAAFVSVKGHAVIIDYENLCLLCLWLSSRACWVDIPFAYILRHWGDDDSDDDSDDDDDDDDDDDEENIDPAMKADLTRQFIRWSERELVKILGGHLVYPPLTISEDMPASDICLRSRDITRVEAAIKLLLDGTTT